MSSTKPALISYVQKSTTNNCVNKILKNRTLFKYFIFMDMNNQIITNHQRISVNENTSYDIPAACHSVTSTVPYNHTYEDASTHICT